MSPKIRGIGEAARRVVALAVNNLEDFASQHHSISIFAVMSTRNGAGKLDFHIVPEQPGLLRLFPQVQIGKGSKFPAFTINIVK